MRTLKLINPFTKARALFIFVPPSEGIMLAKSRLGARILRAGKRFNPKLDDLGIISRKLITTAGMNYFRDDLAAAAGSADITNFKYHAMGTGNNAENVADTTLQTEVETRSVGTQVAFAAKQYQTVATISATAGRAITEHGILSASSVGTLLDRSVFTVINLSTGDSIVFTYTLTLNDGG